MSDKTAIRVFDDLARGTLHIVEPGLAYVPPAQVISWEYSMARTGRLYSGHGLAVCRWLMSPAYFDADQNLMRFLSGRAEPVYADLVLTDLRRICYVGRIPLPPNQPSAYDVHVELDRGVGVIARFAFDAMLARQGEVHSDLIANDSCRCMNRGLLYLETRPELAPGGVYAGQQYAVKCRACGRRGMEARSIVDAVALWRRVGPIA